MAKDRSDAERKERKEKKHKDKHRTDENGVRKHKKEKKEKSQPIDVGGPDPTTVLMDMFEEAKSGTITIGNEVIRLNDNKENPEDDKMDVDVKKETLVGAMVPFANPLLDEKTMRKVLKGVKRAAKHKTLKRGVKEVVKSLRKSNTNTPSTSELPSAIVILAADISPLDVISHIPVLCEDHNVPYVYVPSRAELGAAGSTKRPTSVVMLTPQGPKTKEGAKKKEDDEKKEDGEKKEDKQDWSQVYADLVKVVEKASRGVKV